MKKLLIFALVLSCSFAATSQVKFGVRAGLSSTDFNPKDLVVLNNDAAEQLKISVDEATYGFHFGLFTQIKAKKFVIQPEVVFNSNEIKYNLEDLEGNVGSTVLDSRYNFVDIPVMVAYKLGPLRIQGGPVGHFFVNSVSDLKNLDGYKEKFDTAAWGVQYGFGLDIWKTVLDIKWERNFNNFGDHLVFNDVEYNFDDTQKRFIVSLGIKF